MDKKTLLEKLEAQLKVFDEEIQKLSAKVEKVRVDLKADLQDQIRNLTRQRDSARKTLEELREKGGDAWEELREGAEAAWRELKSGIDRAMNQFK
ncbi:MAG: hypothetical protein HBSIN02_05670 [Bacteroidia bacterium]|nr:MAG: hypothetical protein HBSIN02_05670 [Bacteroidia bacterium]